MTTQENRGPRPLRQALAAVIGRKAPAAQTWEEHDRQIQERLAREKRRDRQELQRQWRRTLLESGVPELRLEEALAATPSPAIDAVEGWTPGRNVLILAGPIGVGKTVAAVWWLHRHQGRRPVFVRSAEFEAHGRYDHEFRSRWANASGMVLDDLGVEYQDARGNLAAALDELVDAFTSRPRAWLVITTNLADTEFRRRYGERIASRLHACGVWRNVVGEDRRRR